MSKVIGLVGGISWESTAVYYKLLNQLSPRTTNQWQQPRLLIESLDFGQFVPLTNDERWDEVGELLTSAAQRLEQAGATVIALGANTAHRVYGQVASGVAVPVLDVRVAVAEKLRALGLNSLSLLGTRFTMHGGFYAEKLRALGIDVVVPTTEQTQELTRIIYDELTVGIVNEDSRESFIQIAQACRELGGEAVGLCCTEFGLLVNENNAPFPFVDSTVAHVEALIRF